MLQAAGLREALQKEIIGQNQAVEAVVRAVVVADLGICDPQRPLGTFLFLGPTGTGKSQLGHSLARILHGDEKEVVAVNCTEFKNPHDVAKLTGAPPGYIGHEQPTFLTQEKLQKKFTIVIFEELEKADRALYDLLLQILERAELKTGRGVDLSFNNCFIFMTTNLATRELDARRKGGIGFNVTRTRTPILPEEGELLRIEEDERRFCIRVVEDYFGPEFINRIDEMIVFKYLQEKHLLAILEKFLLDTRARLAMAGLGSAITDAAKKFLIEIGTNLRYGARPLRRAVREHLEFPLAALIAQQGGVQSNSVVHIDVKDGKLEFQFSRLMKSALIS